MRLVLAAVFALACAGYLLSVEHRISAIRSELRMADVTLVEGDSTLGRPQELTWKSGTNVVVLKVYRATATETSAEWTTRLLGYVADYQAPGQYPPTT